MLFHLQRPGGASSYGGKQRNLCHSCLELQELRLAQASIMSAYRPGRLCTAKSWLLLNHCGSSSCSWSASLARDRVTLNSGWMSLTVGNDAMRACRSKNSSSWLHLGAFCCRLLSGGAIFHGLPRTFVTAVVLGKPGPTLMASRLDASSSSSAKSVGNLVAAFLLATQRQSWLLQPLRCCWSWLLC